MVNACRKGKRVELQVANWLKASGVASARRTQQHNGAEGLSDVVANDELPHFHIEVKGTKTSKLPNSTLLNWSRQLIRDCPEGQIPVLFHQANGQELVGMMLLDTFWAVAEHTPIAHFELILDESLDGPKTLEKLNLKFFITDRLKGVEVTPRHSALVYKVSEEWPYLFIVVSADYIREAMLNYEAEIRNRS